MSAAGTTIEMPAESRGAAADDGSQDFEMLAGEPTAAAIDEPFPRPADDIGHLQGWPLHLCTRRRFRVNHVGQ